MVDDYDYVGKRVLFVPYCDILKYCMRVNNELERPTRMQLCMLCNIPHADQASSARAQGGEQGLDGLLSEPVQ